MTANLVADTWATIRDLPDVAGSCPTRVMEVLAAFQTDPCASSWYGFIVRLGLLVHAWEVRGLLRDRDPFPAVTALALADAKLGRDAAAGHEVG